MKNRVLILLLCCLFLFLLFFPTLTLEASKTGLLLWFDTLLPTLLPFLILSQLILKTSIVHWVEHLLGTFFRKCFHCSDAGIFCLVCGFLCGYPVGARLIAMQIQKKHLSLEEGQYLLAFCNNVSPMFCISYGILFAMNKECVYPYLLIIYGSALLFGILTRPKYLELKETKKQTPEAENIFRLIDVCIIDSFLILLKLCGYMILFSILCSAISLLLPKEPVWLLTVIHSSLEITGGLSLAALLPQGNIRITLCIAALTFGGLCCILQTNSVICNTGLSLKKYIIHKLQITLLALFLFFLWCLLRHFFFSNGWS